MERVWHAGGSTVAHKTHTHTCALPGPPPGPKNMRLPPYSARQPLENWKIKARLFALELSEWRERKSEGKNCVCMTMCTMKPPPKPPNTHTRARARAPCGPTAPTARHNTHIDGKSHNNESEFGARKTPQQIAPVSRRTEASATPGAAPLAPHKHSTRQTVDAAESLLHRPSVLCAAQTLFWPSQ